MGIIGHPYILRCLAQSLKIMAAILTAKSAIVKSYWFGIRTSALLYWVPLLITWGQEIEENLRPKLIEWITKRQRQLEYLLLVTLDSTWLAWHCWWIMNMTFITRHQTYGKCHKALEHWRPTYVAKYKAITEKMAVVAPSHLVEEEEEANSSSFFLFFFPSIFSLSHRLLWFEVVKSLPTLWWAITS